MVVATRASQATRLSLLLLLLVALQAGAGPTQAREAPETRWWHGELSLASGLDFSSGDYDDLVDTEIWYVPVSVSYLFDSFPLTDYEWDRLELKITVPYIRIEGPGDFFFDRIGDLRLTEAQEEGLGDVVVRGTYLWLPAPRSPLPVIELTGKVKLPTADEERGLGTGKTDYTLQLDVARRFGEWTPFLGVGYRFVGRPPGSRLDGSWFASAGATYRINERVSAGLLYDWFGAATPPRHDSHEVIPYVSLRLSDELSVSPYLVAGLSGHTPDYGLGFSIRYRIPVR